MHNRDPESDLDQSFIYIYIYIYISTSIYIYGLLKSARLTKICFCRCQPADSLTKTCTLDTGKRKIAILIGFQQKAGSLRQKKADCLRNSSKISKSVSFQQKIKFFSNKKRFFFLWNWTKKGNFLEKSGLPRLSPAFPGFEVFPGFPRLFPGLLSLAFPGLSPVSRSRETTFYGKNCQKCSPTLPTCTLCVCFFFFSDFCPQRAFFGNFHPKIPKNIDFPQIFPKSG